MKELKGRTELNIYSGLCGLHLQNVLVPIRTVQVGFVDMTCKMQSY